jgi:hypothetical protein
MYKFLKHVLLFVIAGVLCTCRDREEPAILEIAQAERDKVTALNNAGGTVDVTLTANREITVTADASAPWCTARNGHLVNGIVKVRIETDVNHSTDSRTAVLTLQASEAPDVTLTVVQSGAMPFITVPEAATGISIDGAAHDITLHVSTNIPVDVLSPEWINPQTGNPAGIGGDYNFSVAAMPEAGIREGKIAVARASATFSADTVYVAVKQEKKESPFNKNLWTITCDNQWTAAAKIASILIDGKIDDYWHTEPGVALPHWITVDMQEIKSITGFYFWHRQDGSGEGNPKGLRVELSTDNTTWETVYETDNLSQSKDRLSLPLANKLQARYFRMTITATQGGSDYTYLAEVDAYNDVEF